MKEILFLQENQPYSIVVLILKIKLPVILPAKVDLFRNSRELQSDTSSLWQNYRQVPTQNKEGTPVSYRGKGGRWGAVTNGKSLGVNCLLLRW